MHVVFLAHKVHLLGVHMLGNLAILLCLQVLAKHKFKSSKALQWTLVNPNSLGPEPIQISEIFGLVKATAATCVIVTAPYLHSGLGSLGSLPLLHVHRTQNTAPKLSFSTLLIHLTRKT